MNAKLRLSLLWQVLSIILVSFMLSCGGGGKTPDDGGTGVAPQIFGLDKSSANIGDTVSVIGSNFGASQTTGQITLNGVAFQVNTWSDTTISATVVSGMTSGIVVVTQGGTASQSGQQAQLFIGSAPQGDPVIYALSPDYGRKGEDEVLITGANFGSFSDSPDTGVFFSADVAVSAAGYVKAQVVINESSSLPEWTASSIRVIVPSNAKTGDVYVSVAGTDSNHRAFEAQPPAGPQGAPVLTSFTPPSGPIGTQVTILGNNFGNQQGNSSLTISGQSVNVIDWTNTQILGTIPAGATSGAFNIGVGGNSAVSGSTFIVANTPVITGATPTSMHVGQSLTIFGQFFGFTQGAGTLKVGASTVAVDSWNDTTITVTSLPGINAADPNNVPIIVTNDAGLSSLAFPAKLVSDISGLITVRPKAGVAGKTNFKFSISAAGGSGNYEFTLFPDANDPGTTKGGSSPIQYQYASKGTYSTQVRIKDNVSGDIALVAGPEVTVVGPDDMVITQIETVGFQAPSGEIGENPSSYVYLPPDFLPGHIDYNDFVFYQNQIWFGTPLDDLFSGSTKLPAFKRDQAGFLAGSANPRPYGYRHPGGLGSLVRIHGFNFGSTQGEVRLNATSGADGTLVDSGNIAAWGLAGSVEDQDELIEFYIPSDAGDNLSGYVVVVNPSTAKSVKSIDPLLVSATVTDIQPPSVALDGTLQISGHDLSTLALENVSGSSTKIFFIVPCDFQNPLTSAANADTNNLVVHPYDVTVSGGNQILFNMANLGATIDVLATDGLGAAYAIVQGATPKPGTAKFFIWTGADTTNPSNILKANSGLFSDIYTIQLTAAGGGGGNTKPDAALSGNPLSGSSPLDVSFNASASSDPDAGDSITKFEFDFDEGAGFVDNGTTATIQHTFNADGTYNVVVRVTDSGTPGLTDTASVTVTVGGIGPGNLSISGRCGQLFEPPPPPGPGSDPWNSCDPLSGVHIKAYDSSDPGTTLGTAISDAAGAWTISGLPDLGMSGLMIVEVTDAPPSGDTWFPSNQGFFTPFDEDVPAPPATNSHDQTGPTFIDTNNFT